MFASEDVHWFLPTQGSIIADLLTPLKSSSRGSASSSKTRGDRVFGVTVERPAGGDQAGQLSLSLCCNIFF